MVKYTATSKDGKVFVEQQQIKADITDVMFDIDDKKTVNKLRTILKQWGTADAYSRKIYNENKDSEESL